MSDIEHLKYPIGKFQKPEVITSSHLNRWIATIEEFPQLVAQQLDGISTSDYDKTYRPGGWSVLQLVHHCADSHMNAFIRFKLSLTEESPVIRPYLEDRWALLPDVVSIDAEVSLQLLKALHKRWATLLQSLQSDDLAREYIHPEHGKRFSLAEATGMYDWHCRHHLEHMKIALKS
ncbi:MAG: metal-dependent hydrolase [Leeuwenhoekiella sp.]|nr:MAG: metal-dependent hydrolase [Leeuwenhoekiella sp.]